MNIPQNSKSGLEMKMNGYIGFIKERIIYVFMPLSVLMSYSSHAFALQSPLLSSD